MKETQNNSKEQTLNEDNSKNNVLDNGILDDDIINDEVSIDEQ